MLTERLGLCTRPFSGEEKARFCPGELCLIFGLGRLNTGSLLGTLGIGLEGDCVAWNNWVLFKSGALPKAKADMAPEQGVFVLVVEGTTSPR